MLNKEQAQNFFHEPKCFEKFTTISISKGSTSEYKVIGHETGMEYRLTVYRGRINEVKISLTKLVQKTIVLVRVDVNGPYHSNPDGESIGPNHYHLYDETFKDRFAYELDEKYFKNIDNIGDIFNSFCRFCNIDTSTYEFQEVME